MSISATELHTEYDAISRVAARFIDEITKQLRELLEGQNIHLAAPIESRVKSWSSFEEKLDRRSLDITSVKDLNDLIGLRLILLFRRDLDAVELLLKNNFDIVQHEDTAQRLKEDTFGYASVHYVLRLPDSWMAVPTLRAMQGLRAEVQVRTMAQHIWASASHLLQYKQEANIPKELRRTIHRSSALLEIVDLEFERVLKEKEQYQSSPPAQKPSEPLNVLSLEAVLESVLPAPNKKAPDEYDQALLEAQQLGFVTGEQVTALLKKSLSQLIAIDGERAKKEVADNFPFSHTPELKERAKSGVYFTHVGLLRTAFTLELGKDWRQKLSSAP